MGTRKDYTSLRARRIRAAVARKRREAGDLPTKREVQAQINWLAGMQLKKKGSNDDNGNSGNTAG